MLKRMPRRALIGGLTGAWFAARGALAAQQAGEVESSRGECYAQTSATRRALEPAGEVFIGDTVGTGEQSALSLHLGTATQVKLGAVARLRIDRFVANAGGVLVLESGGMVYDHDASADQGNVTVRVPFGLVAVRGTRFFAGPSNGVFGVFVARGRVMVVGVNTAVMVTDGFGSDLPQAGAEPTAPHAWGAARIASAMASVM
ncbi:MAG TPA: FecR domain-containing protein [Acetobacteraceae bacterium]|nr:FecR domain-containing protein [Acetobacteraceae bacterium]